jgi:hypothetical protein
MSPVSLSWSQAKVKDAQLVVPLEADGDIPSGWKDSFETTVTLLGSGEWGEIEVKKRKVLVSDVTPGSEAKLKHHLEAIVAQANAAQERSEAESEAEDERKQGDGEAGERAEDEPQGPDAEMTERFRSA